ncbi:hypothetical protein GH714_008420 [Hevea brasiliensis]|uniref:Uncharacterized protein n=1 Tax=Hevea brasiliensis TaxID=3981 RepID=A0A6A6KAF3_HEVBR|nr:hypothetical protein GH714_008420 [Hevea brasiliensis]
MESHQLFRYGITGAGISYSSSYPIAPSMPNILFESFNSDIGNSPSSTFSNQFDCDSFTTLSESQEQYSSTENPSGASPSCNSSLESSSYFHQLSPPLLHDANSSQNIKHALLRLETVLMGPDDDENITMANTSLGKVVDHRHQVRGLGPGIRSAKVLVGISLRHPLFLGVSNQLIEKARGAVSISGEPIQRLGAYLVEGLVARKKSSGNNIYRSLSCREPESRDLLSYMQILYEICPYLKFGYMAANGAIAEACKNEDRIHIIDFQIAQGTQWITLLQALAAKPDGAPHVRITGIDDPVNKHARGDGLEAVQRRLAAISEKFNIAIEFHGVPVFAPDVTRDMLDVRPGEALAVNFPLQLHHTPDESVDVSNPRDGLLRMVKSLNPKVVTLVEQESNTNTAPFLTRFIETLDYYLAMFESIDVTLPRDRKERIGVEQHCLAKDIVNVIACEGKERVERHELFGKWKSRLTMAGFRHYPLSSYVNSVISRLLRCYSENYTLVEKDGVMLLAGRIGIWYLLLHGIDIRGDRQIYTTITTCTFHRWV